MTFESWMKDWDSKSMIPRRWSVIHKEIDPLQQIYGQIVRLQLEIVKKKL